jgi:hypothetical protein
VEETCFEKTALFSGLTKNYAEDFHRKMRFEAAEQNFDIVFSSA